MNIRKCWNESDKLLCCSLVRDWIHIHKLCYSFSSFAKIEERKLGLEKLWGCVCTTSKYSRHLQFSVNTPHQKVLILQECCQVLYHFMWTHIMKKCWYCKTAARSFIILCEHTSSRGVDIARMLPGLTSFYVNTHDQEVLILQECCQRQVFCHFMQTHLIKGCWYCKNAGQVFYHFMWTHNMKKCSFCKTAARSFII